MSDVTDFERDAISFALELGQKLGVQPKDAFAKLGGVVRRLSTLREQWVAELEAVLQHAVRDRDYYKALAASQAKAIDLASMALTDWNTSGSKQSVVQAKLFLEAVVSLPVNGQETPGEGG